MSPTTTAGHTFTVVGAVHPVGPGWLVVSAKLRGGAFVPDLPRVVSHVARAVEGRPRFDAVGVNVAVGDPQSAKQGTRACDVACAELIGLSPTSARKASRSPLMRTMLKERRSEATATLAARHQRTLFEYLPALSLYELTAGEVVDLHQPGAVESALAALVVMPGIGRIIEAPLEGVTQLDLVEATLGLWTARRVVARLARRLPEVLVAGDGFRLEILR